MFLFRRGDAFIENTGQTFRSFLENGFEGHRAVLGDWVLHVNSLFPEARLKRTLEVRSCDALPQRLSCAVPALATGLLYDDRALDEATELVEGWRYEAVQAARAEMAAHALRARFEGQFVQAIAERVFQIAEGGLERRARLSENGEDERVHLGALRDLLERGHSPADALLERFTELGEGDAGQRLIATTRIDA
jgi:glutamate--cysteine ligase